MQDNVVRLTFGTRPKMAASVSPALFYRFSGDPAVAVRDDQFMEKAAAFQEIRDCLVAADQNRLAAHEVELRIQFLVRTYLSASQLG